MNTHARWLAALCVLAVMATVAGCSRAEDPRLAQYRGKFLLADEPADATSVIALREELAQQGETAPAEREVALVGVIGGANPPWVDGQAVFVIADPSLELADADEHAHDDHAHGSAAHGHAHAHDDDHDHAHCAFCKVQGPNMESLAVVQFHNEQGQILPLDARKLLGIGEQQMVVVRGKAYLDESKMLIVAADGLYVRQ